MVITISPTDEANFWRGSGLKPLLVFGDERNIENHVRAGFEEL